MGLGFTPAGGGPEIPIDLGRPDCGNPGQDACPAEGSGPFGNAFAIARDPRVRALLLGPAAAAAGPGSPPGAPAAAITSGLHPSGRTFVWLAIAGVAAAAGVVFMVRR